MAATGQFHVPTEPGEVEYSSKLPPSVTQADVENFQKEALTYILIVGVETNKDHEGHGDLNFNGTKLIHWQLQLSSAKEPQASSSSNVQAASSSADTQATSSKKRPRDNLQDKNIDAIIDKEKCFAVDARRIIGPVKQACVTFQYLNKARTSKTKAISYLKLKKSLTPNGLKAFIERHQLMNYCYDQNNVGCCTWMEKTLVELHKEDYFDHDGVFKDSPMEIVTSMRQDLGEQTRRVRTAKANDSGENFRVEKLYFVAPEQGKFFTWNASTSTATMLP